MIPFRRQLEPSSGPLSSAEHPEAVRAYAQIQDEMTDLSERARHRASQIRVDCVPTPEEFSKAFLCRRATSPEVSISEDTERLFLLGFGVPGRHEIEMTKTPVYDRYGGIIAYRPKETHVEKNDSVVTYCEISWSDIAVAQERSDALGEEARYALCHYFQVAPSQYMPMLLALSTLSLEELTDVVAYTYQNAS